MEDRSDSCCYPPSAKPLNIPIKWAAGLSQPVLLSVSADLAPDGLARNVHIVGPQPSTENFLPGSAKYSRSSNRLV